MMVAPVGRSRLYDVNRPMTTAANPKITEIIVIDMKRFETTLAAAAGITRNALIRMIPTTFAATTTVTAINTDNR